MLVLIRKAGEEIAVNHGDITISVLGITGNKVRLGVSAPLGIPVHRMEIHRRIIQAIKPEAEPEEDPAGLL
jgi:carbon storage regulator